VRRMLLLVGVALLIGVLAVLSGPAYADIPKAPIPKGAGCTGINNAVNEGYENFSITESLLGVSDAHECR
jgi:hypothetical protein